jgi:hypothetical protein
VGVSPSSSSLLSTQSRESRGECLSIPTASPPNRLTRSLTPREQAQRTGFQPQMAMQLLQSHKASRLRLPRAGQSGGQSLLLVAALHPVTMQVRLLSIPTASPPNRLTRSLTPREQAQRTGFQPQIGICCIWGR